VNCVGISAGSQHSKEALEWIDYLSHQAVVTTQGLLQPLPARPSVAETHGTWQGLEAGVKDAVQFALKHAMYRVEQPDLLAALRTAVALSIQDRSNLPQAFAAILDNAARIETAPSSSSITPVAVNPPIPTPQVDEITIHYLANWGSEGFSDRIAALIPEFQSQNPGIRVDFSFGFNSSDGYILRDLAKNYDCFTYYSPVWEPVPEADLIDLEPLMEVEGAGFREDFLSAYLDSFRVDGKLYALPADVDVSIVAYNQSLFTDLGLLPPEPDWTLQDLLSIATKAANNSTNQPIFGFAASADLLLDSRGVQWYEFQDGIPRALFNTPEMASTLEWINQLYNSGAFLPAYGANLPGKPRNYTDYEAAISNGQVAMWVVSAGDKNEESVKFKIGYASLPVDENG
ncbi:extracellular solute-binding protein, partial [bacterium]|nr:extracellular solute-binding protein [bacterium]